MKVVYYTAKFEIVKTHNGYVVRRKANHGGKYEQHSHFKKFDHAKSFLTIITKGLLPRSKYWIIAAKRILTKEEFDSLKK